MLNGYRVINISNNKVQSVWISSLVNSKLIMENLNTPTRTGPEQMNNVSVRSDKDVTTSIKQLWMVAAAIVPLKIQVIKEAFRAQLFFKWFIVTININFYSHISQTLRHHKNSLSLKVRLNTDLALMFSKINTDRCVLRTACHTSPFRLEYMR